MYYLLKNSYDVLNNLKFFTKDERYGNKVQSLGYIKNLNKAKTALLKIQSLPVFEKDVNVIVSKITDMDKDEIILNASDCSVKESAYIHLMHQIDGIINLFEMSGFDINEQGFDIKMPQTNDFDEFTKNISDLNRVLSQCPYLNNTNEKIVLKKADLGSIWFEFAVAASTSSLLLFNLAKIVDKCTKIKSHMVNLQQQKELLKMQKLKNEQLETVMNIYKEVTDRTIDSCIKELQAEIPDTQLDGEGVNKTKMCLENLSTLMTKGLEIYASIDAPKEVKDCFPTTDEVADMIEPIKLLTDEIKNNDE